jgi:2-deoxy-D-gluconate 3-dehydrogenase
MDLSAFSLHGRTVMVTGANTGIGQGIALAAAKAGARIVGVARSSLEETAGLIAAVDGSFVPVTCDLSDLDGARKMLRESWAAAPIDALVNNAGIIRRADAVAYTEDDWDAVLSLNLKTLFFLSQEFARLVLAEQRRGKIVNVASLLSFQGGIRVPAYTASKHGVAGLTQALSNEWAGQGINVNAIAPGYVESNNTTALRADPDRSAAILSRIPAGRWGQAADIGDAAVFLMAPASDYINGAVLPVDGGWLGR